MATVAGIGAALWSQRHALGAFSWRANLLEFLVASCLLAVAPLAQGISYWAALQFAGNRRAEPETALLVFTRALLLRYAPTGALAFVYRFRSRRRHGADQAQVATATVYEQVIACLTGVCVGVIFYALAGEAPPLYALALLALGITAGLIARPGTLGRWLEHKLAGRFELGALLDARQQLVVSGINACGWITTSAGNAFLAFHLIGGRVPLLVLSGAFALAWAAGTIIPVLPGGLGPREAILVLLLGSWLSTGSATALALALRLASMAGEFLAIGLSELAWRYAERAHSGPPSSEAHRSAA